MFHVNADNYLQTRGTPMRTKTSVSFASIFMVQIKTNLIQESDTKPKLWKRYIDDIFSLWDSDKTQVDHLIEQASKFHTTMNSRP